MARRFITKALATLRNSGPFSVMAACTSVKMLALGWIWPPNWRRSPPKDADRIKQFWGYRDEQSPTTRLRWLFH